MVCVFRRPARLRGAGAAHGRDAGAEGHPAAERTVQAGRYDQRRSPGPPLRGPLLEGRVARQRAAARVLTTRGRSIRTLRFSIDHALRDRGGISEVRRRSGGHPTHFGIRVEFSLEASRGHYTFRVGARAGGGYEVQREECRVFRPGDAREDYYDVESGRVIRSTLTPPPAAAGAIESRGDALEQAQPMSRWMHPLGCRVAWRRRSRSRIAVRRSRPRVARNASRSSSPRRKASRPHGASIPAGRLSAGFDSRALQT